MSVQPDPSECIAQDFDTPRIELWGRLDYATAFQRQLGIWSHATARGAGEYQDVIAVVEHDPVVTLGRHTPPADVLDRNELARAGIAVVAADRGGRATYHGPGQTVVYPIVDLSARGLGIKEWVTLLEDALLDTLAAHDIRGHRIEGRPGIWVGRPAEAKIASVGLRVARGVSYHGVSINVAPQSKLGFHAIVTCGVAGQRITCMADAIGDDTGERTSAPQEVGVRFAQIVKQRLTHEPRIATTRQASCSHSPSHLHHAATRPT